MYLKSSAVWDVLEAHDVEHLYHANSVITSCQFIKQKALLARGAVERMKLPQTEQYTDAVDKRYSLWFDVFADPIDIHERAGRANRYGPVLFVLDLERLRTSYTGNVWVTKLNPTRWAGTTREDRWFQSNADLKENFVYGDFNQMIVFRHCGGIMPLADSFDHIILDDPRLKVDGVDMYSGAVGALTLAACDAGMEITIEKRECARHCDCRQHYAGNNRRTSVMFTPCI